MVWPCRLVGLCSLLVSGQSRPDYVKTSISHDVATPTCAKQKCWVVFVLLFVYSNTNVCKLSLVEWRRMPGETLNTPGGNMACMQLQSGWQSNLYLPAPRLMGAGRQAPDVLFVFSHVTAHQHVTLRNHALRIGHLTLPKKCE
jgi:hypothetical protein